MGPAAWHEEVAKHMKKDCSGEQGLVACEPQNFCLVLFCHPHLMMNGTGGCPGVPVAGQGLPGEPGHTLTHLPLSLLPGVQLQQVPEGPEGADAAAGGGRWAGAGGQPHR